MDFGSISDFSTKWNAPEIEQFIKLEHTFGPFINYVDRRDEGRGESESYNWLI